MALCRTVKDYLKEDGATNDKNDDFLDFCSMFSKGQTTVWYECYRLCARLLCHYRTLFKRNDCSDFGKCLKEYLRFLSKGKIVDAKPLANASFCITNFVKYVVKHLDESF